MTKIITEKIKEYQRQYRESHKEEAKKYFKKRYVDNKDKFKKYRIDNKERISLWGKGYAKRNKLKIKAKRAIYNASVSEKNKIRYQGKRMEVINGYGGKCVCCGETQPTFLSIDHVNGGGRKMRLEKQHPTGSAFYTWLKKQNYPKEFRVLCHNCNFSLGKYGYCPHGSL